MSLKHLRCIFSTWMSFGQDCVMWRIESWPYTSEAGLPHNSSHGSRLVTFVEEHQKCNEICLKWFQKNKTFTTYPDNCNALCSLLSHHWFKPWPWENKIMPHKFCVLSQICVCQWFDPHFWGELFLCICKQSQLSLKILHCLEVHKELYK